MVGGCAKQRLEDMGPAFPHHREVAGSPRRSGLQEEGREGGMASEAWEHPPTMTETQDLDSIALSTAMVHCQGALSPEVACRWES